MIENIYVIAKIQGDWHTYEELEEHTAYRSEDVAEAIARHLEKRTGGRYKVIRMEVE